MDKSTSRILHGVVTVELHGYLADLKVRPPAAEDLVSEKRVLDKALMEMGIPAAAVEKVVVNGSLVSKKYQISVGDTIALFPLTLG